MELRPIEAIRAVGSLGMKRWAGDVAPAFEVEAAGRMEEDSYSDGAKRQDRGMEEEDTILENENESNEGRVIAGKVDVLA
jgi:hypothetical protein